MTLHRPQERRRVLVALQRMRCAQHRWVALIDSLLHVASLGLRQKPRARELVQLAPRQVLHAPLG